MKEQKELRKYQEECIRVCQERKEEPETRIQIACGGGKSLIIERLTRQAVENRQKVVIFVPSLILLEQMAQYLPTATKVGTGYNDDINQENNVYICVYNSSMRLAHMKFDLGFIDEGHHIDTVISDGSTKTYRNVIVEMDIKRRIYLSATLDPEEEIHFRYDMKQAIEEGFLTDYDIIIPVVSEGCNMNEMHVKMLEDRPDLSHVLAYCNSRESGRNFNDYLNEHGIRSCYFDGETGIGVRRQLIQQFEAGLYRVIVTVDVLGEGVDIPCANTCMLVEPRYSRINLTQCVGRILRLHPDKILAHVVLPGTINGEEKELRQFLNMLTNADDRVTRSINSRKLGRITFHDLRSVDTENRELEYYLSIYDSLGTCNNETFEYKLGLLREFVSINDRLPKYREDFKGILLYNYIKHNKEQYHKSLLSSDRISKLESVRHWTWVSREKRRGVPWMDIYNMVMGFIQQNNKFPRPTERYNNIDLGAWIALQKHNHSKLSPEQIRLLESVPGWKWKSKRKWIDGYNLLVEFFNINNRLPKVKERYRDINIGIWVQLQKHERAHMSEDRKKLLEAIPTWIWSELKDWNDVYRVVVRYVNEKKMLPASKTRYDDIGIGKWVHSQRAKYKVTILPPEQRPLKKIGLLTQEQISLLEAIPGWKWYISLIERYYNIK